MEKPEIQITPTPDCIKRDDCPCDGFREVWEINEKLNTEVRRLRKALETNGRCITIKQAKDMVFWLLMDAEGMASLCGERGILESVAHEIIKMAHETIGGDAVNERIKKYGWCRRVDDDRLRK